MLHRCMLALLFHTERLLAYGLRLAASHTGKGALYDVVHSCRRSVPEVAPPVCLTGLWCSGREWRATVVRKPAWSGHPVGKLAEHPQQLETVTRARSARHQRVIPAAEPFLCCLRQAACQLVRSMFKPSGAAMLRPLALAALVACALLFTATASRCAALHLFARPF